MDAIYLAIIAALGIWLVKRIFGKRRMMPPTGIEPMHGGSLMRRCAETWLTRYER